VWLACSNMIQALEITEYTNLTAIFLPLLKNPSRLNADGCRMDDSEEFTAHEVATALMRVGSNIPIFLCMPCEENLSEEETIRASQLFCGIIRTPFMKRDLFDAISYVLERAKEGEIGEDEAGNSAMAAVEVLAGGLKTQIKKEPTTESESVKTEPSVATESTTSSAAELAESQRS
jgi:hypothetical protein